LSLSIN